MNDKEQRGRIETILANEIFKRLAGNFTLYQNIITSKSSEDEKKIVRERMETIYAFQNATGIADSQLSHAEEWRRLLEKMLSECENGNFTEERFAENIAGSVIGELLIKEAQITRKSSNKPVDKILDGVETQSVTVNEVVFFNFNLNSNTIEINISPTTLKGSETIIKKIMEGFGIIAKELSKKGSSLENVEQIKMTSWLLGPGFDDKIRAFFGNDIQLEDVTEDSAGDVKKIALKYNRRSLENFLNEGKEPEIRRLVMTKADFIKKFGS